MPNVAATLATKHHNDIKLQNICYYSVDNSLQRQIKQKMVSFQQTVNETKVSLGFWED